MQLWVFWLSSPHPKRSSWSFCWESINQLIFICSHCTHSLFLQCSMKLLIVEVGVLAAFLLFKIIYTKGILSWVLINTLNRCSIDTLVDTLLTLLGRLSWWSADWVNLFPVDAYESVDQLSTVCWSSVDWVPREQPSINKDVARGSPLTLNHGCLGNTWSYFVLCSASFFAWCLSHCLPDFISSVSCTKPVLKNFFLDSQLTMLSEILMQMGPFCL